MLSFINYLLFILLIINYYYYQLSLLYAANLSNTIFTTTFHVDRNNWYKRQKNNIT